MNKHQEVLDYCKESLLEECMIFYDKVNDLYFQVFCGTNFPDPRSMMINGDLNIIYQNVSMDNKWMWCCMPRQDSEKYRKFLRMKFNLP